MSGTQTLSRAVAFNDINFEKAVDSLHSDGDEDSRDAEAAFNAHPLGVKPSGNALAAQATACGKMGVFGRLPGEIVLGLLEWLDGTSLLNVGASCRGLYAYTTFDQLWKDLFIIRSMGEFTWRGSWRSTYMNWQSSSLPRVDCSSLFSDALHRPFFCSQIPLLPYTRHIPSSNEIPRLSNLDSSEFSETWSDKPFILTAPVKQWPVQQKWCKASLLEQYGEVIFRVEAVNWQLQSYFDYMSNNIDESPLYLFDRNFVEKMNLKVGRDGGVYWPPDCFGEDLFMLLGDQRPDHRWLIIGPERSGSTFHKDPNATSAWNAVIRGSKYWIMFPSSPNAPSPPGVFVSNDQSEVTSPLSIAEWLLTFHDEARNTPGCLEGICSEGEVLHVPSGCWHLVVNLEPAIAITQNFVPRTHLTAVVDFLKKKPEQVTGFKNFSQSPHELFMERLQENHPHLIEKLAGLSKKRKWDEVVRLAAEDNGPRAFSFGFGVDEEEDQVEQQQVRDPYIS